MWMIHEHRRKYGTDLDVVRNVHDTMLKSQLANDYRTKDGARKGGNITAWRPNDLASVLARYLDIEIAKSIDHEVTDWTGSWSNEMIEYMLEDIQYLEPLNDELDGELLDQGQERAAWIENGAVFAHAWMTYNGITPDVVAWRTAIADWRSHQRHLLKHLHKYFPEVDNFQSPAQIQPALTRLTGGFVADTKHVTLKQLAPYFPEIAALVEHRYYSTRLKNWGEKEDDPAGGFLGQHVCSICQRFHPEWRQIGCETARVSCSRPNLQQIPRNPEFRALFVASEGCLLASLDYSAIEVLTAGVYAGEKKLIRACATGDPHKATAEMIVGHEVHKKSPERQMAKIANFGLLFGGGRDGLIQQARDLFDTDLTIGQAEQIIAKYYSLYPRLRTTKNAAYQMMEHGGPRLTVQNAVGFRRILEGANRKPTTILNTWIQSTAGYGMKSAYPYIMEAGLLPFLCLQVHDELVSEFPEEDAEEFAQTQRACMIKGMQDVLGADVPVHVDASAIGRVWL